MRVWGQEGGVPGPSTAELIPWEQGDTSSPLGDPKLAGTAGFSPVLAPPGSSLGLTCPPRWAALDLSSHTDPSVIGLVSPFIPQTLQTIAVWTDD